MLAMWLAVAMLWAQWAGVLHRIDHANGEPRGGQTVSARLFGPVHTSATDSSKGNEVGEASSTASLHSCLLFDGLCLAESLPTTAMAVGVLRLLQPLPSAVAFAFWHGPFTPHFLSRAPPDA